MGGLMGGGNTPTNAPIHYSGLNVSSSQWNMPVPIFWGTRRLSTNAIAYANFQKHAQSGKGGGKGGGGKGGTVYTYTADVLLGLSEGVIDAILHIWANGSTTTTTTLSALKMTFFNGALGQANWSYWASKHPTLLQGYSQTAYLGAVNLDLGESATIPDNGFECVRTNGFAYVRTSTVAGWINPNSHVQASATDVLLSDVIPDLLTNVQYGALLGSGDLGDTTQFAAYQRAQGLFVSPLINSQEKANDVLNRWSVISNSWIFWTGVNLAFVPLADAPITGNGVTFTPQTDVAYTLTLDDLIASPNEPPVKITRKDPADCYNRTTVSITDRTLGYIDNPLPWRDDTLIDAYGLRDNTSVSGGDICDPAVGRIVAQLIGKRAAYIRNSYSFKTAWPFLLCLPGTVLMIPLNYTGRLVRVRVTSIAEDAEGNLSFEAEEFPGTTGTYVAGGADAATVTAFPNTYAAPDNVNTPAIFEPPASFTGGTAKVIIAASGENNWGGCTVYLSFDGTSYTSIGKITAPAPQGVLTASLASFGGTNPDTGHTLSVDCTQSGTVPEPVTTADADALRTLSLIAAQPSTSGGVAIVPTNGELLAFGNVAATGTYTADLTYLQRGQYGTAAASHATGDQFTVIDVLGTSGTSIAFDLPTQYIGAPLYIKLASFNEFGNAAQDLSVCTEYRYTPTGAGYGSGSAGAPKTPTGLATVSGPAQIAVQWSANAPDDQVTTYRLYRANGSGASFSSASLVWQGYALNFIDSTVAGSTAYTYFLTAVNAAGTSGHTAGVSQTSGAGGMAGTFIFNEVPSGTVDGTNVTFTLAHTPIGGSIILTLAGSVLTPGTDYTMSSATITMAVAPTTGSTLLATYLA